MRERLVVVGGGLAASRAVGSYREAGGDGEVRLLQAEPFLPYHRPPLSKGYLRGERTEMPYVADAGFYSDHQVELLEEPAVAVDLAARRVAVAGGELPYDKLLVATGSEPRRLDVPGFDLAGVFLLRTVVDATMIRQAAAQAERAVVVGGGFIGMEAAASLTKLGLAVTQVHLGQGLFDQLRSPLLSASLHDLYRREGVSVLLEEEVARFGGDERLAFVETKSGRRIEADLAVVGVGVRPNTDLLAASGLVGLVGDGVVVDERLESAASGVYAAGDVASFLDPLFGRRRVEHWSNADYQGRLAGRVLAGGADRYDTISSFFSEVFGRTVKVFGDTTRFDSLDETGSLDEGFLALYGREGRLVGAVAVAQDEAAEAQLKELIGKRAAYGRELATAA